MTLRPALATPRRQYRLGFLGDSQKRRASQRVVRGLHSYTSDFGRKNANATEQEREDDHLGSLGLEGV